MLTPKRSWFQYRLLTLFVVVTAFCIFMSTVGRKMRERAAVAEIKSAGGRVKYDWQQSDGAVAPGPAWLGAILGQDFFAEVVCVGFVRPGRVATDANLTHVRAFPKLERLILRSSEITDAGLGQLGLLRNLKELDLHVAGISDAGLTCVAGGPALRALDDSDDGYSPEATCKIRLRYVLAKTIQNPAYSLPDDVLLQAIDDLAKTTAGPLDDEARRRSLDR